MLILESLFTIAIAIISASVLCLALGGIYWKAIEPHHEADDFQSVEPIKAAMGGKTFENLNASREAFSTETENLCSHQKPGLTDEVGRLAGPHLTSPASTLARPPASLQGWAMNPNLPDGCSISELNGREPDEQESVYAPDWNDEPREDLGE